MALFNLAASLGEFRSYSLGLTHGHRKMICRSLDDQQARSFLKQRISIALHFGNAACVLGTVSDGDASETIYYIWLFQKPVYHCGS